jgi:hypothetical protein
MKHCLSLDTLKTRNCTPVKLLVKYPKTRRLSILGYFWPYTSRFIGLIQSIFTNLITQIGVPLQFVIVLKKSPYMQVKPLVALIFSTPTLNLNIFVIVKPKLQTQLVCSAFKFNHSSSTLSNKHGLSFPKKPSWYESDWNTLLCS